MIREEAPAAVVVEAKTRRVCLRLTADELADLQTVARDLGLSGVSELVREALDSLVGDFRERGIFDRRQAVQFTETERRRSPGRRAYDRARTYSGRERPHAERMPQPPTTTSAEAQK